MADSGSSSASWGPYHHRQSKSGKRGKGKWAMSTECFDSMVEGAYSPIVGGRRSAIVGGPVGLPPPPPPPPTPWQEVLPPPAKSRPHQPSYPPPVKSEDGLVKTEVKEEIVEVEGQVWEISVVPDAPPLNGLERPAFVLSVRLWLETNLSSYELSTILE